MFCVAAGAGFSTDLGFADFGAGTGLDVFFLFTAVFAVDVFFVVEAFFTDADFAAGFAVDFFAAGFEAFIAGAGFVFFAGFLGFKGDLLFFAATVVFLDVFTAVFVVFFFIVPFFTIYTSSEN